MDPQRRINFAVNCFSRVRGVARFQGQGNEEAEEDKTTA